MFNIGDFLKKVFPPVEAIGAETAWTSAKKGDLILIDVREAREIAASGKCKGARHVPLSQLRQTAGGDKPALDRSKRYALYCENGARSMMGARMMKKLGYETVYNLGTFRDWKRAGLPVEK